MADGDPLIAKIIGYSATPLALLFYIAPAFLLKEAQQTQNLKKIPFLMLLMNFVSTIPWIIYGAGKESGPMGLANVAAEVFNSIWIIWFFLIFLRDKVALKIIFISSVFLSLLITAATAVFFMANSKIYKQSFIIDLFGYVAAIFNILMYASPGQKIVICLLYN